MKRHLAFDFIGRRNVWFAVSGALVVISTLALLIQGLNLSIDFRGGSSFTVAGIGDDSITSEDLENAASDAGAQDPRAQLITEGDDVTGAIVQTRPIEPASEAETAVAEALSEAGEATNVEVGFVGPTWGDRISRKMLEALVVFLVIVVAYISVRLEFKMSLAALVALVHDLALTAGIYAIFQFNVSPATVIALLTILGYSLYDTVIVFDRVDETADRLGGPGRRTYAQAVNTSLNDVLWRSINTTITSGLPVGALLFIGAQALGAVTLQDLALALFVGMISGAYSSLFIAGPVLVMAKEREPRLAQLAERAERRGFEDTAPATTVEVEEEPEGDQLEPRGYVRGRGRTPRRKR